MLVKQDEACFRNKLCLEEHMPSLSTNHLTFTETRFAVLLYTRLHKTNVKSNTINYNSRFPETCNRVYIFSILNAIHLPAFVSLRNDTLISLGINAAQEQSVVVVVDYHNTLTAAHVRHLTWSAEDWRLARRDTTFEATAHVTKQNTLGHHNATPHCTQRHIATIH